MSVSIKYKNNEILSIPSSGDYKLNTSGKYLEDDIRITATGGGSAAVVVTEEELSGGGIAKHINAVDISDTTAVAADVAQGKYFYTADGTKTQGTASGGTPTPPSPPAPWVRPSDWPDLSQMDVSGGDILYMTSYADEARGFCYFYVSCTGSYTVEVGTISGSTFTAESTQTYTSGSYCKLYYGSANGTYKVLKVTGTAITKLDIHGAVSVTIDTFYGFSSNQGIIDIVGKLPSCTSLTFWNQRNLVNVQISDVTLSGSVSNMFYYCHSLASLDTSGWNTSNVTSMSSMFYYCTSLTSLDVSSWNTGSVTSMSQMFYYCTSLTSLDVSSWNTDSVTTMSSMFYYCTSLTSLDVSSWNTDGVTDMSSMFNYCTSLTSLDVSSWNTDSVTTMSNMFYYCYSLTSLDVSSWNTDSVTTMSNMFYNCNSLTSLDVSEWDTSSITNMNQMFSGCYSLTSLDVSSWNTDSVTTMSNMFYNCCSLTSLDVSEWDTSSVTTMNQMFSGCYSFTSLDVSGLDTSSVTNMGSMFYNCYSLTSLDVSGWDTSSVTTMNQMFNNCYSLTSLDVSEWDTSSVTNMSQTFNNCYSLTSLDISGWNLTKITTANNIGSFVRSCQGLYGSITLPSTMAYIGTYCFNDLRSINEWHFLSTTPPTLANTNAFNYMTDSGGKKIYVPVGSLNAYKTATNWSTYADYIEEEPA